MSGIMCYGVMFGTKNNNTSLREYNPHREAWRWKHHALGLLFSS